jgi:phage terminase large subunit GpA-like protein
MRERNEALDCYVYARASASVAGLDRFEERHWRELEKQIGLAPPEVPSVLPIGPATADAPPQATHRGGLVTSDVRQPTRRVIRSRWFS